MHTSACDFQIPEIGKCVKEASMPLLDNVTLINLHLMQLLLHKFSVRLVKIGCSRSFKISQSKGRLIFQFLLKSKYSLKYKLFDLIERPPT
jgi:hypothetical protein